jgi:hypothetical protein
MRRWTYLFTLAAFLVVSLRAQEGEDEPSVGYLRVFTDADLVQIYLDGEMIGYTPILEKITVTPGWHHVSFFSPDFKWDHWTHRQRKVLINVVEAGTYHVLVEPGELVEVHMAWHELERQLERYESGRWITAVVGMVMVAAVLVLLAMTS